MEAVLGAEAARRARPRRGRASSSAPTAWPRAAPRSTPTIRYEVTGVLAPTGTAIDRLVLTSAGERLGRARGPRLGRGERGDHGAADHATRTPVAALQLPRLVNATTALQAASPAYEGARLMSLVGAGVETLRIFALVLMASAALSVFIALTSALEERRYDLALLRTLGARPGKLFTLVAVEGMTLVVAGAILGLALGHGAAEALGRVLEGSGRWPVTGLAWEPGEAWLLARRCSR